MLKKTLNLFAMLLAFLMSVPSGVRAYEIPKENSNLEFFYVFGPDGKPGRGAEKPQKEFYFDVPDSESRELTLEVYDPDTTGKHDAEDAFHWTTATKFEVFGQALLTELTTGVNDTTYNKQWVKFGPFKKEQGQKVGSFWRFKIVVTATQGADQNLFKFSVTPETVESFVYDMTFRLASGKGRLKYFYPAISAGTKGITVVNYDLDPMGGRSKLFDNANGKSYAVNDSDSGQYAETKIALDQGPARKLVYQITRGIQFGANAGLKIFDDQGNPVPIYFTGPEPRAPKAEPAPAPAPAPTPKPKKVKAKPAPEPEHKAPVNACNRFTFDGRDSYDPNKDKITYAWDFGDGTTSTDSVVSHVYEKGGLYKVLLTVSDNSGLECEKSVSEQSVKVNTPPTAGLAAPELTCAGSEVTFDASATKDDAPANLTYHWTFSDGTTAEGPKVTKAFEKGGNYDAVLTVDDGEGTSCSTDTVKKTIRVNAAPVAKAGQDVTLYLKKSDAPYHVTFDGSKSSDSNKDQLSYNWNFGDGSSAEGVRVEHTYEKPGEYKTSLTVNDNTGLPCATSTDAISVKLNKAPVAKAGEAKYVCEGTKVVFDGSSSVGEPGESLAYNWDFGDGAKDSGKETVKHAYAKGGNYTAVLTVDDGQGTPVSQAVDSIRVSVNSHPNAAISEVKAACTGNEVWFDASGSSDADGDSLKYTWNFGDGTTAEGKSKMGHRYTKGGTYKVTVSVDDGKGSPCSESSAVATVKINTPPAANAGPNLVCCQEGSSSFDGSASSDADGDKLSYSWNFGDGQTADTAKVSHAYHDSGTFNVVLTVDDGSGTSCSSSSAGFTAKVNAKPVSVIKFKQS